MSNIVKTKYVVTDPCYILPDEAWHECCKAFDNELSNDEQLDLFDKMVAEALTKFVGSTAYASSTGFGDWTNTIHGKPSMIIQDEFAADSGMVCVCPITKSVDEAISNIYEGGNGLAAIIECEGDIKVDFDRTDASWTVVNIEDAVGNCFQSDAAEQVDEDTME